MSTMCGSSTISQFYCNGKINIYCRNFSTGFWTHFRFNSSATSAHAQQQANTTGGVNMTGKPTGPGAAIPGNVTNPTNATSSPSAVGGGNITSPSIAQAANQTATMQYGG
jgi:hypothetical protein